MPRDEPRPLGLKIYNSSSQRSALLAQLLLTGHPEPSLDANLPPQCPDTVTSAFMAQPENPTDLPLSQQRAQLGHPEQNQGSSFAPCPTALQWFSKEVPQQNCSLKNPRHALGIRQAGRWLSCLCQG